MAWSLCFVSFKNHLNGKNVLQLLTTTSVVCGHRNYSHELPTIYDTRSSSLKRGRGGRCSFDGNVATVFGASGFIGRYVCNRLGKSGTQMILPYRGDPYEMRPLKVTGDLGQVLFIPFNLRDEESIRKAVKHSNVVVNLIGRDWETRNYTFHQVHVEGAERLARISKEMGVRKFIHMSALNSDIEHEGYWKPGGSGFLKSKGESENAVKSIYPNAIIFRPSDVYGQEDRFLRYFCGFWRRQGQFMPLPHNGNDIWKQPVFVGDVAQGITNAVKDDSAMGKIFEAAGPRRYELKELIDWFFRVMRRDEEWGYKRYDMKWDPLFKLRVRLNEQWVGWPLSALVSDKVEREAVSDTVHGLPSLEDLGVTLTFIEDRADWELKWYRAGLDYDEDLNEFEKPAPPKYAEA